MTYEEAKQLVAECGLNIEGEKHEEVLNLVLKALDKQIPQKPLEVVYPWAICPSCSGSVSLENVQEYLYNQETSYCEHCGQALDWSK